MDVNFLELIQMQKIIIFLLKLLKYRITLLNQQTTEKSTKKFLIDTLSKRLLELEFKSNHSIKSKGFKMDCQEENKT